MKSAIVVCLTLSLAASVLAQSVDIGSPPGKLVEVGGRRLHLLCTGTGGPTVVMEAGASAFAIDWSLVQPEIARTNRFVRTTEPGTDGATLAGLEIPASRPICTPYCRRLANSHRTCWSARQRAASTFDCTMRDFPMKSPAMKTIYLHSCNIDPWKRWKSTSSSSSDLIGPLEAAT